MEIYKLRKTFTDSILVKQIVQKKFPDKTVDFIVVKFIEFWNRKFKRNPTISDFVKIYNDVFITKKEEEFEEEI